MKSSLAFARHHILPAAIFFAAAWLLAHADWFDRIENLSMDVRTRLRDTVRPAPPPEDVVIIAIDEPSLRDFGRWPWPRDLHGDFLKLLGRVLPSVVTWDILFTEAPAKDGNVLSTQGPDRDQLLADGIEASGGAVVLGAMRVEAGEGLPPGDAALRDARLKPLPRVIGDRSKVPSSPAMLVPAGKLAQIAEIGFVDTPPASDGVRRVAPLMVRFGDNLYPTLSLQSLLQHWEMKPENVEVRLGDAVLLDNGGTRRRIPIDATGGYQINYRHSATGFTLRGYSTLHSQLQSFFQDKKGERPKDLTGKILLVGQFADALSDNGPTPFEPLTPLVLVHANVIANVLAEDYVRPVPPLVIWLGGFVLGVAGLIRFSKRKLVEQAVFSLGLPIAFVAAALAAWVQGSWLVPVAGPLLGFCGIQVFMIGRRVLAEQRAKEQIKGMFGTYLSPELVKRMVDSGESPQLGGHEEEITAYFSDIQGFSTFSEQLPADRLVELMNEYLTACTDIVQEEGGTLDKYIGDAVVAMFGAPIALPDHAYRACVATQRVQARLAELRAKWQAEGDKWPPIVWNMQSRIGLNTGRCIIGNMGSRTRFNYTMMGDDVNLAARMESGAKTWGVYNLCTEATRLACEQHGGDRVVFRPLGRIVVKGRARPVPIHEIVGLKESIAPSARDCIGVFSEGLECYYRQEWQRALACFRRSAGLEPNIPGRNPGVTSNPSLVYGEMVTRFESAPPGENWDGVYVMKEK
ncbi:MAG: adenylate/guanylate cyclase domain-containing protein [Opitutaceae bacterium]|nr:adenylate/guanylate cyclase domain-containing protein [Opitutaceae bacterium]